MLPLAGAVGMMAGRYSQRHDRALCCEPMTSYDKIFEPVNKAQFPTVLEVDKSTFELVSSGTRRVTFLSIAVYDVGIYLCTDDIGKLRTELRSRDLGSLAELQAKLLDPMEGPELFDALLDLSFAIRITPTRDTDIAHMRDGFVRGILARCDSDEDSLQSFKEFFPNPRRSFKRNQIMLLTSWKGRELNLNIDGHNYGSFEAHTEGAKSQIIKSFLATYVAGKKVASESVRQEFVTQISALST